MGGCGLTAFACDKLNKKEDEYYMRGIVVADTIEKQLGYDWAYLQGFTCGFDGKHVDMLESFVKAVNAQTEEDKDITAGKAYAGYLDGIDCHKAVGSPKAPYQPKQ